VALVSRSSPAPPTRRLRRSRGGGFNDGASRAGFVRPGRTRDRVRRTASRYLGHRRGQYAVAACIVSTIAPWPRRGLTPDPRLASSGEPRLRSPPSSRTVSWSCSTNRAIQSFGRGGAPRPRTLRHRFCRIAVRVLLREDLVTSLCGRTASRSWSCGWSMLEPAASARARYAPGAAVHTTVHLRHPRLAALSRASARGLLLRRRSSRRAWRVAAVGPHGGGDRYAASAASGGRLGLRRDDQPPIARLTRSPCRRGGRARGAALLFVFLSSAQCRAREPCREVVASPASAPRGDAVAAPSSAPRCFTRSASGHVTYPAARDAVVLAFTTLLRPASR